MSKERHPHITDEALALGSVINRLRKEFFMPRSQLADVSEMSTAHISLIERGMRYPSPDYLRRIARSLGTTREEIMTEALAAESEIV